MKGNKKEASGIAWDPGCFFCARQFYFFIRSPTVKPLRYPLTT